MRKSTDKKLKNVDYVKLSVVALVLCTIGSLVTLVIIPAGCLFPKPPPRIALVPLPTGCIMRVDVDKKQCALSCTETAPQTLDNTLYQEFCNKMWGYLNEYWVELAK